jgi:hypothetical protein
MPATYPKNDTTQVPEAACPRCGGWTQSGGMSHYAGFTTARFHGRTGCQCGLPTATLGYWVTRSGGHIIACCRDHAQHAAEREHEQLASNGPEPDDEANLEHGDTCSVCGVEFLGEQP